MNAEHDVKPAWARLASWTAGLPAIALACAASGALAGTRPMDAYFDAQIAVAKKTIDACIAANEGTSSASGCDDEDKVFLPAFYPRIVAPIFSRIDLSSPSATLDKVQSGYAKEASQLTQLESTLSSAMQTRSHDQLAADLQGQVESAFQSVRSLAGSSGTLIDLYNIDSQKPLAGWRYGGAMIPYGALDTFALATAAQKIYELAVQFRDVRVGNADGLRGGAGRQPRLHHAPICGPVVRRHQNQSLGSVVSWSRGIPEDGAEREPGPAGPVGGFQQCGDD